MKPQEPIPHNYSISTLNKIFALSSLGLLMGVGAMVAYDYISGWKRFQVGFMRLEEQRIRQELRAAEESQSRVELTRLDEEMQQREEEIARNREGYRSAQNELRSWEGRHYAADQNFRFAKATLDALRYEAEVAALKKRRNADRKREEYEAQSARVEELKLELEEVTRRRDAAKARVDGFLMRVRELEDRKKESTATIERLRKQLETVAPTPAFLILNAPLLDFINPTLRVDQVVVEDMFIDINYLHVPRVDRCMTCHRAIERPGFESKREAARLQAELQNKLETFQIPPERVAETEQRIDQLARIQTQRGIPNPYRTHPFLDTFVGSASAHPLAEFGCTSCHRGLDRSTNFARAGHTPMSRRQEARWKKSWHWKAQKYLETPMYPRQYFQAACVKCHSNQITVDSGPAITRGMTMVELYGCHACHKIDNWRFTALRKPGPDLNGIAEKTTPQWVSRWLADPHSFRSTTRMPAFFHQRNMNGPAVSQREREQNTRFQNAEIQAIVSYLFNNSTRRPWNGGGSGDPVRGEQLVGSVGCLGCHIAQDTVEDEQGAVREARRDDFPLERHYGFNLVGTGTKTDAGWLFNWLKDPRRYYHSAPMPDLRLTDQEAADITAYLMTLQKPDFMQRPLPPTEPRAVAELAKNYLINTMTDREANERLASMPLREQLDYLGQRTIEKYGCYSCHDIKGFEGLKPIGTELTIEGSKTLHLFDFGLVHDFEAHDGKDEHILHTVPSWIYTKVRAPRVWDDHREKPYQDKLKMPNFRLSPSEAQAITSVILGLTKERVDQSKNARLDPRSRAVEEGRKLVSQHNCRGCHVVEGYGRAIETTLSDPGLAPPDLTPQGSRVQSPWLFHFLKDPTVMNLRPWLSVRMPTFHFTDLEANTLVQSFAADGNVLQFDTTRYATPHPQNVAVGQVVFEMLRCAQCHPSGPAAATSEVADAASLAPNLSFARVRLQHDWIPDWIRRPNEIVPGTRMPTNFPRDPESGDFTSPLGMAIDTPAFSQYKARLSRYYPSDEEMRKALDDVVTISGYLRDYIWTLGPSEMRIAPATGEPRPQPPGRLQPTIELPAVGSTGSEQGSERPAR
ncbi:MAG TPA: hypothetical protein VMT00_03920 [Thermoanaerobaculia bacterium]|nr:hypothetical protein [Thermoanaerobaculia bacterium]